MADYVSISEFAQGWTFYTEKISVGPEQRYGHFQCSNFDCSGCDDWLDCNNQNRTVTNSEIKFILIS